MRPDFDVERDREWRVDGSTAMKDAYELLHQKEAELVRLRQEVESLRMAASLLGENAGTDNRVQIAALQEKRPVAQAFVTHAPVRATGTRGRPRLPRRPSFWDFLKPTCY
jgi:hypothetical protein